MGEHFRKEEEEFITSITSVQKKIDALSLQTNRTSINTKTRNKSPLMISKKILLNANAILNLWKLKLHRYLLRLNSNTLKKYFYLDAGETV